MLMTGQIQTFVPKADPVKAFQIPSGDWIVLSADLLTWEEFTEAEFNAKYTSA